MNFEDDEDDPFVCKNPELRARIEELNDIVLRNLPTIQIDESDTTDEPIRILSENELRTSSTSLFSSSTLTASSSREIKSDKKDDDKNTEETFFQAQENLDNNADSEYVTNTSKEPVKILGENGNADEVDENANTVESLLKKESRLKLKSEPHLTNEECSAAQGDGHQFSVNREEVVLSQINKNTSVTSREHMSTLVVEKSILEEGDCGARKIATSSGSRPEMSENAWKRASASTSNCGRPATVPKARPRRSETASVMTNTERDPRELKNQTKGNKGDDDDSDSDDNWEDPGKGYPVPKPRTLGDKRVNVDITRQRSILDLCSVEHGETVQTQPDHSDNERKSDLEAVGGAGENLGLGTLTSHVDLVGEIVVAEECDAAASAMNSMGDVADNDGASEILFDSAAGIDIVDLVDMVPRAFFRNDTEQCENYSPMLMNLSDDDLDPRLLKQRLQVAKNEWN